MKEILFLHLNEIRQNVEFFYRSFLHGGEGPHVLTAFERTTDTNNDGSRYLFLLPFALLRKGS